MACPLRPWYKPPQPISNLVDEDLISHCLYCLNLYGRSVRRQRGDRIAQLVIQQVARVVLHEVESLPGSARGDGGFGSTGGHAAGQPTAQTPGG